jgi:hypothetical protein
MVAGFVLLAVAIAIAIAWVHGGTPEIPADVPSATPGAGEPPSAAPSATTAVAPASVTAPPAAPPATASAKAATPATTAPLGKGDLAACVAPVFPSESFDSTSDFSFLCSENDTSKARQAFRTELVRVGHNLSDGMREWALLGWYELPTVAMIRARCCPAAAPLELPETRSCTPMADILSGLATAAQAATDPADKTLQKAVDAYTSEVYCVVRSGIAHRFGRRDKPEGGEDTTFQRFLARFVKARR